MSRQTLPIIGSIIGAVIGGYTGGPTGAAQGAQYGYMIGSILGPVVDPLIIQGNKIGDNPLQVAAEGGARAIVFGQGCVSSTCIIARGNRTVVKTRESQGGKGSGPKVENETVHWTFAIGLGEDMEGAVVSRVWQDENLVYNVLADSGTAANDTAEFAKKFRFYDGRESQLPDPDLQVFLGDDTPYFRGTAYIVFPNFDLTNTAERIPQFKFEIVRNPEFTSVGVEPWLDTWPDPRNNLNSHEYRWNDQAATGIPPGAWHLNPLTAVADGVAALGDFYPTVTNAEGSNKGGHLQTWGLTFGDIPYNLAPAIYDANAATLFLHYNPRKPATWTTIEFGDNECFAGIPISERTWARGQRSTADYGFGPGVMYFQYTGGTMPDADGNFLNNCTNFPPVLGFFPVFWCVPDVPVEVRRTRSAYFSNKTPLSDIIATLLMRAGMAADQFDVTELDDMVVGVVIQETVSGSDAVAACLSPYFADPTESDGKLRFVKRGKPVIRTLTIDDLIEEPQVSARENAIEYPQKVHFFYQSPVTDYATTKATSSRYSTNIDVVGEGSVTAPVTFDNATEPANIAAKIHKIMWNEAAGDFSWIVGYQNIDLTPGDCIGLSLRGVVNRARVTAIETDFGKLSLTMRRDRQSAYEAEVTAIPLPTPTTPLPLTMSKAVLAVLDIPALTDADDQLCYYTAMSGSSQAWQGGQVQRSLDTGASWTAISDVTSNVVMGKLREAMTVASPFYVDDTNRVLVQLFDIRDEIVSMTDEQWMSEGGAIAVQADSGEWEVMQYRDAEEVGDGLYSLTMLQRGRLNTAPTSHSYNGLFILLGVDMRKHAAGSAWLATTLMHRGISYGTSAEDADELSMTYLGRSQIEWPVAYFDATYDTRYVRVSNIVPRHRFGTDAVPVRSVNWEGYRITVTGSIGTLVTDTVLDAMTIDCNLIGTVTEVAIAQLNRITGAGEAVSIVPTEIAYVPPVWIVNGGGSA